MERVRIQVRRMFCNSRRNDVMWSNGIGRVHDGCYMDDKVGSVMNVLCRMWFCLKVGKSPISRDAPWG